MEESKFFVVSAKKIIEIPSEIEGKRVTKIGDYAFSAHKRKEDEAKEIMIGEDFLGSEDEPMFCGRQ